MLLEDLLAGNFSFSRERVWKWVGDDLFGESCWMMNLLIESFVGCSRNRCFLFFFFLIVFVVGVVKGKERNEYLNWEMIYGGMLWFRLIMRC